MIMHYRVAAILISTLASTSVLAFPKLNSLGSDDLAGLVGQTLSQSKATQDLLTQFTSQLPLSPQQAGGGVATLLTQAQNNLTADQSNELNQLIPSLNELTGLIPNQNLSTILQRKEVNQAFNTLGLDASMVEQFVPVLMQYLTQQGASQNLLESLGKLWQ
ncbi:hypothetical protein CGT98_05235 [Vibrio metoecus]|uniref:DUF2780 domain-containing protein n=2 Tax=Vibrio metoecus TaxID=1481663 RepID=A0A271VRT6_VIBMT|nr:hypothetical protein CGU03_10355 [Vibrio metoecus]PAR25304.1 hypothetical protein CGU02_04725 [Vibrio metoecus]PAR31682.1 hypothetical protein CGT99_09685 [Vibrio metoecus]PAR37159.1 hypothetical protein CGT97_02805 [Vibrio metoecus]PAR40297.1 hypothetical protein CGT98_05235 [Vibrio metoecus]